MQSQNLLPPDHPNAPKHWQQETSGALKSVVWAYLTHERLTLYQIALLRAYLKQWVYSPVWKGSTELDGLREQVTEATTQRDLDCCIELAVHMGLDPL